MMFFGRHGWSGESGRTYTFKCALTKHGIPNDSGGIYVATEDERRMIEEDLIRGLKPKMNDVQMPRCEDDAPNTPQLRHWWQVRRDIANWFAGLFGIKRKDNHEGHSHAPKSPGHKKSGRANDGFWS